MTRIFAVIGIVVVLAAGLTWFRRSGAEAPAVWRIESRIADTATLYCEFYNFFGRSPKVGFTFAMTPDAVAPTFAQTNQIEMDGTRTEFGTDAPRPAWAFAASESQAVLISPDGAIQINLYAYDPARRATTWFEAGLRSVQYLNLDGKCRQSVGSSPQAPPATSGHRTELLRRAAP